MMPTFTLVRWRWPRYQPRTELVVQYLTGQGALQVLNGLNGFWLLRWLSIDEQAKFTLAMALQATLGLLGDLGIGGSLLGLLGDRLDDKIIVGQYIRAIQFVKNRLLLFSLLACGAIAVGYQQRHGWRVDFALIVSLLLVSVYAQSESGYYAALLQANRKLSHFYRPQLIAALMRLLLSWGLAHSLGLTAWWAVLLTTAGFVVNAYWQKRQAATYYVPARQTVPSIRRQIRQTLLPLAPMVFYYALQGQLTGLLAGFYGQSTTVAGLGALSRLAQLFALLTPFSTVVLLPYLAHSPADRVLYRYLLVGVAGLVLSLPIVAVGYLAPRPFLWLLGDRFSEFQAEIGPYLLSAAVWYVTSILWAANIARCWNRWYTSLIYVGLTLGTQCISIAYLDLSVIHNLVRLGLYMACSTLVAYLLTSVVGYLNQTDR